MRQTIFFLIAFLPYGFSEADLCHPEEINYTIGRSHTLLDVDSEIISRLQQACYKQFNISGIVKLRLFIAEISVGGNKYFGYQNGIGYKVSWDKVLFSQNSCPSSLSGDNLRWVDMTGVRSILVRSPVVCFKFAPSLEGRYLGAHIRGKRVRVMFVVDVAVCNLTSQLPSQAIKNSENQTCQELCDVTGVITTCQKNASRGTTLVSEVSVTTTTTPLSTSRLMSSLAMQNPVTSHMFYPLKSFTSRLPISPNSTVTSPVKVTTDSTVQLEENTNAAASHNFSTSATQRETSPNAITTARTVIQLLSTGIPNSSTSQQNRNLSTFNSTPFAALLNRAGSDVTKKPSSPSFLPPISRNNVGFTITLSYSHVNPTDARMPLYSDTTQFNQALPPKHSVSTVQMTTAPGIITVVQPQSSSRESGKLFGLVDGLYILVGCVLMVLVVVVITCCMYKKYHFSKPTDHDCHTISSSQARTLSESCDMPWRDNWLVRHHSVHRHDPIGDEDAFSQSEKDLQMIHGNFVHQSNPELHLIHTCQNSLNDSIDSIYDNNHYLLKLNKDDFDAKVKDVLRNQRLLSITSYDSAKPIQRRRANTLSESSFDSRLSLDRDIPVTVNEREHRYRRKCQRSSSAVSSCSMRNERIARVTGKRRSMSQRSHCDIHEEDDRALPGINDLNKVNVRNLEDNISVDDDYSEEKENQETLKKIPSKIKSPVANTLPHTHANQTVSQEITNEKNTLENMPKQGQKEEDAVWTVNAMYALVSQPHGTSGTMQFKK